MKNILIVAAENSAENYGAQIVEEFNNQNAPVRFFGIGGDRMAEKGVELVIHNKELSVVGIIEVISSLFKIKRCMNLIFKTAVERCADAVLLIDYPDFNLRMAKRFKNAGIPVYYYISPTVWAWRYNRVKTIRKYVDHLFIIFPFEIPIYHLEGIPFTYTGHPLLPLIKVKKGKKQFREQYGVTNDQVMITLLPGSRKSEIHFLLPYMLEAMKRLKKEFNPRIFLLKADNIDQSLPEHFIDSSNLQNEVTIISQTDGYDLIAASDAVLTTCGTSNLEIAVLGVPFAAVYQVNKLSYRLGKRFVKIDRYSIVNILAGEEVIKELIQHNFTVDNITAEMRRLLLEPGVRSQMLARFAKIRKDLEQEQHPPRIIYDKIMANFKSVSG